MDTKNQVSDAGQEQEIPDLLDQVGLDIRLYAHDDRNVWKYIVRLCDSEQSAKLHTPRFVDAVNREIKRLVTASLAKVLEERDQYVAERTKPLVEMLKRARYQMTNQHYNKPRIGMETECDEIDDLLARYENKP